MNIAKWIFHIFSATIAVPPSPRRNLLSSATSDSYIIYQSKTTAHSHGRSRSRELSPEQPPQSAAGLNRRTIERLSLHLCADTCIHRYGSAFHQKLAHGSDAVIHGKFNADTSDSSSLDVGREPSDKIGARTNAQGARHRRRQ